MEFFRKPIPREHFKSLDEIPYDRLKLWGFEVIIFDYDNTLAPFLHQIQNEVLSLLKNLIKMGFKIVVVTNASYGRTKKLRSELPEIKVFAKAKKPGLKVLKSALKTVNAPPSKVVFVGDLFFTDIIAGNRMGMYTIMVEPYPGVGIALSIIVLLEKISYYFIFYTFGWLFRIGELISPNEWADTVFDVNYDFLISKGIKLFVFDMDGTLTKWRSNQVDAKTLNLLKSLSRSSKVVILSNGNSPSLDVIVKNKIAVFKHAHKPLTTKMMRIMKRYGVSKKEVAVIGDQLFTDILMANLAGP
ncbi:MAG: HAD-IIIA family hydrolase [Thermotogae bacterium]|nr:HAD-IIIA family hydrolase [Thermotogota bacterium]